MADFFGFNSTADFEQGLHDDPGDGLDEDADDYDALNDETFGADCLGGDWEQAHEELSEIENSRVRQDSYNSGNGERNTAQEFDDELDLDLEASVSQLVDDYDDVATEPKVKNKNHTRAGVIELGYSCSPPSEFNVWAVRKNDQVRQHEQQKTLTQASQLLPTKKIHTLEELERGLRSQARPVVQAPPPRPAEPEAPSPAVIGRPPATLRLEDVERDLTAKNKLPPGFRQPQFPQHNMQDVILHRNMHNEFPHHGPHHGPPPHHPGMRGAPPGPGNFGPMLMPQHMLDFHHQHPHHRHHMGQHPNMMRFLPPHMMLGAQQQMQRNNMNFRHPYPPMGMNGAPPHLIYHPMMRPPGMHLPMRGPPRENGHHRDEYEGLMSNREIQWLLNIQLLQLNTTQPFQDDFYYTVYQSRKPKNRSDSRSGRERRDSLSQLGQQQRTYTPLQFENSLGKLQIGSVTAPRKIIDMDVVSEPADTGQSVQKDSRRVKQLLLQLEQMYLLLMQLEDADNPLADAKSSCVDKPALVQKIIGPLLTEDRLQAALCVRKGKNLLYRLLPYVASDGLPGQQLDVWCCLLRNLIAVGRRDADANLLPLFVAPLRRWLEDAGYADARALVDALKVTTPVPPSRNLLVYALTNKFGVSALAALILRGEELFTASDEKESPDWSAFIQDLLEASSSVTGDNPPSSLVELDAQLLRNHLGRFSNLKIEKYATLVNLLTGGNNVGAQE